MHYFLAYNKKRIKNNTSDITIINIIYIDLWFL